MKTRLRVDAPVSAVSEVSDLASHHSPSHALRKCVWANKTSYLPISKNDCVSVTDSIQEKVER